ncbi:MAG: DUF503 domain-containing protein [Gammaproteobacteria bacterium]|nr:DUF503 domain-containing protein [Gammaproteobacteria bacterium]
MLFELHISSAQSLKDKRRIVSGLKDRLSSRFNISVAELGELENRKRSVIGLTMISNDRVYLEKQAVLIENILTSTKDAELLRVTREWF